MQDVLVVASAAFGKNITVYSLDKDDYLHELYISACKNPREHRLCLARAGKKYFAVLPAPTSGRPMLLNLRAYLPRPELTSGAYPLPPLRRA